MGPHSFERGNLSRSSSTALATRASMGPHSFERGNTIIPIGMVESTGGFNGASLFRARKPLRSRPAGSSTRCFNGASLFRARKLGAFKLLAGGARTRFNGASLFRARKHLGMLPGDGLFCCFNGASLFRARKRVRSLFQCRYRNWLQWGLTLSSEETFTTAGRRLPNGRLQWGLTLSSEETRPGTRIRLAATSGFNGASLFRARKHGVPKLELQAKIASMGPHSFERGNWTFAISA